MPFLNGRPGAPGPLNAPPVLVDPVARLERAGAQHARGDAMSLTDLLLDMPLTDNRGMAAVRRFAVETLGASEEAYRSALKREATRQQLGFVPETPAETARAVSDLLGIRVRRDGAMRNAAGKRSAA